VTTESHSGFGRALAAGLVVPSEEFDATMSELQTVGRVESGSQAGEDSVIRMAAAARRINEAQKNLSRLQKLQRERKGELRDAVALEKDIAQADAAVSEATRVHEDLLSTVAQSRIRVTLIEEYRVPLRITLPDSQLEIRNALTEGIGAIFSSVSLGVSILLGYGLPLLFWLAILFFPLHAMRRRFRRTAAVAVGA
jgi:uncharacterized protein DUF4349